MNSLISSPGSGNDSFLCMIINQPSGLSMKDDYVTFIRSDERRCSMEAGGDQPLIDLTSLGWETTTQVKREKTEEMDEEMELDVEVKGVIKHEIREPAQDASLSCQVSSSASQDNDSDADESKRCGVCDRVARCNHFGAICCDSCKAFFRRSVQSRVFDTFFCLKEGKCDVNQNRKSCQACRENAMMRAFAEEAMKYGELPQPLSSQPRHVTVLLNPAASGGKGKGLYERYCAPLLHLAGIKVATVRTEHEGQAKDLMAIMENTSAVVVAGGDGTLSEVLTGLLRRSDQKEAVRRLPLGILPLGKSNSTTSAILGIKGSPKPRHLAEATMSIIHEIKRPMDVMEVTPLQSSDADGPPKPVYAASHLEWGAYRDARERNDVYWYWATLKRYMTYVFSSYKGKEEIDYSNIINEECGTMQKTSLSNVCDVAVFTKNNLETLDIPGHSLLLKMGSTDTGAFDFIKEGWSREWNKIKNYTSEISVGEITIQPTGDTKNEKGEEREFNIDSESFEVRPMKIKALPNAVTIFAPNPSTLSPA
ncbi:acylglycerol kinase, mitochondrial-like isoform X5 [Macrobrachium rosenbergii]|uniref:acylglycerol kinase, mitochondrial-like isoform X5 n=1 Tax=Macrobrachium rosenbergii TaxID=79674 RepID=UPI0034D5A148